MRALFVVALACVCVSAAAACDESTSTTTPSGELDGGPVSEGGTTTDAATDAITDAGSGLVPNGLTKIVFTSKGGFVPSPPDGSTCSTVDITYTIVLPARDFSWKICEATDAGPNDFRTGQRTLSAEQYATVDAAIHALKRQTQVQCGADKPSEQITFTSPSGDVTYYDDFYFCDPNDPKLYVSGLEDVFTKMTMLVQ